MSELVKNAADPNQVRAAHRKEKEKEHCDRQNLLDVLSTRQGRSVMWRLLEHCNVLDLGFRPDSETQYFNGKKSVAAWLMKEITSARQEALFEMSKEAQGDR
jgi:hypothetical protein